MSRTSLPAQVITASEASSFQPFWACDLMFDSPNELYFWNGIGSLSHAGNTYVGAGNLLDLSELRESSDIAAYGATLTLSGIPTDKISLALSEPYQGRKAVIRFGVISGSTIYSSVIFTGEMDQMNIALGPDTSTITLSVESRLVDLNRARIRRYTDADQKSRYPLDRAFEFVTEIQDEKLEWEAS